MQERLRNPQTGESQLPGIDIQLPVTVNYPEFCNAHYSRSSVTFYQAGGGCINSAYDTIIDHEYGHFVDDMAGRITDGGLSEGWGDILAAFATGQPLVGEGLGGGGTAIRTADNAYRYPLSGTDEVHELGQAWAGFAWHLRQNLMASQGAPAGIALAEQLVIPTLLANAPNIPSAVYQVLLQDDADGDPFNGTPHVVEIVDAVNRHGIYGALPYARITDPSAARSVSQRVGTLAIRGTAKVPEFQQYQLFYREWQTPMEQWTPLAPPNHSPVTNDVLGAWDIREVVNGFYLLKLVVSRSDGRTVEDVVSLSIELNPPLQLTQNQDAYSIADISGDRVVWWQRVGPNAPELYVHDLSTGVTQPIRRASTGWVEYPPAISGKRVVWVERNATGPVHSLYLYDVETGQQQTIASGVIDNSGKSSVDISGDLVVWVEYVNGNWDVFLSDIVTGGKSRLTTHPSIQSNPAISGNVAVWQDCRNHPYPDFPCVDYLGNWDLYMCTYNPQDGTCPEQQLTNQRRAQFQPAISGRRIVWTDLRYSLKDSDFTWHIYSYDLDATAEQVISNRYAQEAPAISGDLVVWVDLRDLQSHLFLYDLSTGIEKKVTSRPKEFPSSTLERAPAISGERIVWSDRIPGDWGVWPQRTQGDIYVATLHRPVFNPIGDQQGRVGASLSFTVSATDAGEGDVLHYTAVGLPRGATFNPESRMFEWVPGADQVGSHRVTFFVKDLEGWSDSRAITIKVVENQPPSLTMTPAGSQTVNEGRLLAVSASATDVDGDTLSFQISGLPSGALFVPLGDVNLSGSLTILDATLISYYLAGRITLTAAQQAVADVNQQDGITILDANLISNYLAGSLTGLPPFWNTRVLVWTPGYDQAGSYPVTVTVSDGSLSASETVTITVQDVLTSWQTTPRAAGGRSTRTSAGTTRWATGSPQRKAARSPTSGASSMGRRW